MKVRALKIIPVLNGFIVEAGCQMVVFESREKLILELGHYYAKPKEIEAEYLKNAVNPMPEEPIIDNRTCEQIRRGDSQPTESLGLMAMSAPPQTSPATPRR